MPVREFSVVLAIMLLCVWVYLLLLGRINQWGLVGLVIATVVLFTVVYNAESISRLSAKAKNTEILVEMRQMRDEVYAKTETVKKIAEETAELTAFAALNVGRFAAEDLQVQLLKTRDRVVSIMHEVGISQSDVEEMRSRFEKRIADDLRNDVSAAVQYTTHAMINNAQTKGQSLPFDRGVVVNEVLKRLSIYQGSASDRAALLEYLTSHQITDASITKALDVLDHFLKTRELPASYGPSQN